MNLFNSNCSLLIPVGTTGFEPAASCTPCKRATGLRYVPNFDGPTACSKPGFETCGSYRACKCK